MAIESGVTPSGDSQQRVLADLHRRTGRSFVQLGAIDTTVSETANSVLPVLADWVELVAEKNIRAAIYTRFSTPHANRFIGQMLQWARQEPDELGRDLLMQAIAKAARPRDGVRIWTEVKNGRLSNLDVLLMIRLSSFASVGNEVKDHLAEALALNRLTIGDLHYVAKVKDPRIEAWFQKQVDSADPRIRRLARRIAEKGKELPLGCSYKPRGPDRRQEIFSAERDLSDIGTLVSELGSRFGVNISFSLDLTSPIWSTVPVDRWVMCNIVREKEGPAHLWFRLEDVDVVEIVLTSASVDHAAQRRSRRVT